MKQSFHHSLLLLSLLFLLYSSKLYARPFTTKQGKEEVNMNLNASEDSLLQKLMGSEICKNGDEDCFQRRILSEAHLDYIYTQHYKP